RIDLGGFLGHRTRRGQQDGRRGQRDAPASGAGRSIPPCHEFPPFFSEEARATVVPRTRPRGQQGTRPFRARPDMTVPAFRAKPVFCAAGSMTGSSSSPSWTTGVRSESQPIALATIVSSLEQATRDEADHGTDDK